MGELKDIREEQDSVVSKIKDINEKVYYAALGAVSKVEERTNSEVDKLVEAAGEEAADDNKIVAIAKGVLANVKAEVEKLEAKREEALEKYVSAGNEARGEEADELNKYVLAGIGAVAIARTESEKVFNELVEAGEKRA